MNLAPEYVDEKIRMSWPDICRMACQAMIHGFSLDEYVETAIRDYVGREKSCDA